MYRSNISPDLLELKYSLEVWRAMDVFPTVKDTLYELILASGKLPKCFPEKASEEKKTDYKENVKWLVTHGYIEEINPTKQTYQIIKSFWDK